MSTKQLHEYTKKLHEEENATYMTIKSYMRIHSWFYKNNQFPLQYNIEKKNIHGQTCETHKYDVNVTLNKLIVEKIELETQNYNWF